MIPATERQKQVLNVILTLTEQRGYPPSFREIGDYIGMSVSTVFNHVSALHRKGYITVENAKNRTIRVVRSA